MLNFEDEKGEIIATEIIQKFDKNLITSIFSLYEVSIEGEQIEISG